MELFALKDLSFSYPDREEKALDGINLEVWQGEFVVLCGPSGCGKTTLLRLLKKEMAPHGNQAGEVRYFGRLQPELDDRTAAREIGFVMQNPESQAVTDKVWHELAFGLESLGVQQKEMHRRIGEIVSFFGISQWYEKKISDLSGGQKQLLNLASVMVMQPKVLILDEPTSQLDPVGAAEFITTLHKLNRDLGMTILLVEHRLEEVFSIADRAIIMDHGKIMFQGPPAKVGGALRESAQGERILRGMPSAMRIFNGLDIQDECPLTVKEGRVFLEKHFSGRVTRLKIEEETLPKEDGPPAVQTREVWFRYERELPDVLKGCFLGVRQGETFALLGENGSGKSTFLKVLAGQHRAYRGKVEIFGKKIQEYKGAGLYRHNVALLPQNPQSVFVKSTVRTDLAEICTALSYPKEKTERKIEALADRLEISHLLERHPYDLSGGEQQRAALCKVLLLEPRLLLLDEPTKGIDAYAKATLAGILQGLKEDGVTVLMVTHDVEFAADCADRCAMLFNGEVIGEARPRAFFSSNTFYTTAASRISRTLYENAVTVGDVVELCRKNSGV